ncbi:MAG: hypothetical protein BWY74_04198 [Firmicutes bacterium ADurb.Bin419]|nr:MAG: hypothetical protein BWY74_04198 [Firmicutes bacterium ADurb.Bin419]
MNKRNLITLITVVTVATVGIGTANYVIGKEKQFKRSDNLVMLEQQKQELEAKGEKVPDIINKKIEAETEYSKKQHEVLEKCAEEVKEIERQRQMAPKDANGYPIIIVDTPKKEKPAPYHDIGLIGGASDARTFFPVDYKSMNFDTTITAPYNILVSGRYKDKENASFILNVNTDPNNGDMQRLMTDFTDKGSIIFTSLENDNRIVNFTYANGKQGYFDLEKNEAVFN